MTTTSAEVRTLSADVRALVSDLRAETGSGAIGTEDERADLTAYRALVASYLGGVSDAGVVAGLTRLGSGLDRVISLVTDEVEDTGVAGSAAITEAADTLAAVGAVAVKGQASVSEAPDTLSATGVGPGSGITGSASITEADDTTSAAAAVKVAGAASASEASDTVTAAASALVKAAASITEAADTVTATGTVPYVPPNMYNWNPSTQFVNTRAAYAAGRLPISFFGDSITAGVWALGDSVDDYVQHSSVHHAASKLVALGTAAHAYSNGMNHNNPGSDLRYSLGGSAHWSGAVAAGGPLCELGVNDTLTFTLPSGMSFNRVRVSVVDVGSSSCDVCVDGGSYTGSPQTGTNAGQSEFTFTVPGGSHTSWTVKGTGGGTVYVMAVEVWDTAVNRIECINLGVGGRTTDSLVGGTSGWGQLQGLWKMASPLVFIALGANDGDVAADGASAKTKAEFKAGLDNGVSYLLANDQDVILVMPPPLNVTSYNTNSRDDYEAAIREICDARGLCAWDQRAWAPSWATLAAASKTVGNFHFSEGYYSDVGDFYGSLINAIKA
ncbi:MAG TPA: SGNH/GDSL hydrolase family protein [Caulobacteraceae bacterium]|jgi:lysophospholipase L1-like esterase|nr:SGNH/GDSL hydrolase family protein [Caulobacteraceae bacterium]